MIIKDSIKSKLCIRALVDENVRKVGFICTALSSFSCVYDSYSLIPDYVVASNSDLLTVVYEAI